MTQEVVDRLLDSTQSNLFTMDPVFPLFSGAIQDPKNDLEKHKICKPISKAEKSETSAPRLQKTPQIDPRITKKRFLRKHDFCNTFLTKTLFCKLQLSIIPFKSRCKKWPGNKPNKNIEFKPIEATKLSKWSLKINPKSLKAGKTLKTWSTNQHTYKPDFPPKSTSKDHPKINGNLTSRSPMRPSLPKPLYLTS